MTEEQKAPFSIEDRLAAAEADLKDVPMGYRRKMERYFAAASGVPLANDAQHGDGEAVAVEVKPLVWEETEYLSFKSGKYEVCPKPMPDDFKWHLYVDGVRQSGEFEASIDARDAAEADHRARRLSQITTSPASEIAAEVARLKAENERLRTALELADEGMNFLHLYDARAALAEGGTHD